MKKILKMIFYVMILALAFQACEDAIAGADCTQLTVDVASAAATYFEEATEASCNASVTASQAYFDGGCDTEGQMTQEEITASSDLCACAPETAALMTANTTYSAEATPETCAANVAATLAYVDGGCDTAGMYTEAAITEMSNVCIILAGPSGTFVLTKITEYDSDDCSGEGTSETCNDNYDTEEECLAAGAEMVDMVEFWLGDETISLTMNADYTYTFQEGTYCDECGYENCGEDIESENECTDAGGEWNDGMDSGTWSENNNVYTLTSSGGDQSHPPFEFVNGSLIATDASDPDDCWCEEGPGESENECTDAGGEWHCHEGCMQFTLTPASGT